MVWINIAAVIIAPIIAVWVGQKLQNRAEKRKDKMAVFKAVMTYRYGWSQEALVALNGLNVPQGEFVELCGEGEWFVGSRGGPGDHAAMKCCRPGRLTHLNFKPFS